MARYEAEVQYIASIYPGKLEPVRRHYGPSRESVGPKAVRSTLFELKPVPRGGKPCVIQVMDSFQDVIVLGQKEKVAKPVEVQSIVDDILAKWTGGLFNVPSGAKPGIMQIASTVPTKAELDEMTRDQTVYFEYLFSEGSKLHDQKQWDNITQPMRDASNWLGRDAVWANPAIAMHTGPCPLCTEIIPNSAVFCPQCKQQVSFMDGGNLVRYSAAQILSIAAPPKSGKVA